ncbi:J domain-containing protein DDB_G0295729-like [Diabrotica virgifera virgifera]|uniref:Ty3 transposon capsid-like protein domain-containing protein n=1 Tax=Diabrotica virgifera virgifera TaxID=50390 RepID=A0ABM5JIM2_DIAVI|nr:J domain-containing protein DDB_G0295729-like [Diabrotica virgifera virgifera]
MKDKLEENNRKAEKNSQRLEKKLEENIKRIEEQMEQRVNKSIGEVKMLYGEIMSKHENLETKLTVENQEIKTQIQEHKERINIVEEDIEKEAEWTNRRFNMVDENINQIKKDQKTSKEKEDQLENKLKFEVKEVKQEIEKMEKKIRNTTKGTIVHTIETSENRIYFNGDYKSQHPVPFIHILTTKYLQYNDFDEFREVIRNQLKGEALIWYTNVENEIQDFDSFKMKFLEFFWGQSRQQVVRAELFGGRYNSNSRTSMHLYAMKLYSAAQYLDGKLTEKELVNHIVVHFESQIENIRLNFHFTDFNMLRNFLIEKKKAFQSYRSRNNNNGNFQNFIDNNNYNDNRNDNNNNNNQNWNNKNNNNNNNNYNNHLWEFFVSSSIRRGPLRMGDAFWVFVAPVPRE